MLLKHAKGAAAAMAAEAARSASLSASGGTVPDDIYERIAMAGSSDRVSTQLR